MPTDTTTLTATLERALDQTDCVIGGIKSEQMQRPTPCAGWDVAKLLEHTLEGPTWFIDAVGGQQPEVPASADAAARFRARAAALLDLARRPGRLERFYATPWGGFTGAQLAEFTLVEVVIHAWDLARATDQAASLDPTLAEAALPLAPAIAPPESRGKPEMFAVEVPIGADAPPYDRLAAFLGRQP